MSDHVTAISSLTKTMNDLDEVGHQLSFLADACDSLWAEEATGLGYLLMAIRKNLGDLSASIGDALEVLEPPSSVTPRATALESQITPEQREQGRQLLQPFLDYLDKVAPTKGQPEPA